MYFQETIEKKLKMLCKEINMVEPVQNCFTFYHPDGVSSAHEYSEREELLANSEMANRTDPTSIVAQHDLPLAPPPPVSNNS